MPSWTDRLKPKDASAELTEARRKYKEKLPFVLEISQRVLRQFNADYLNGEGVVYVTDSPTLPPVTRGIVDTSTHHRYAILEWGREGSKNYGSVNRISILLDAMDDPQNYSMVRVAIGSGDTQIPRSGYRYVVLEFDTPSLEQKIQDKIVSLIPNREALIHTRVHWNPPDNNPYSPTGFYD